jgi:hypothetical protein
MPVELQLIRASEFIRLDPREYLDLEASKNALRALVQACRKRGLESAVLDLRALPVLPKRHFTTVELAALVRTFREAGFMKQQRLAVLYRHDVFGGIRDFAFISRLRGLHVQAFADFEVAMAWLSEGAELQREAGKAEIEIPVRKREGGRGKLPIASSVEQRGPERASQRGCKHPSPTIRGIRGNPNQGFENKSSSVVARRIKNDRL